MKQIPVGHGLVALVDDEDYDRLAQHKWFVHIRGRTQRGNRFHGVKRNASLHHEVLGVTSQQLNGKVVDHKDGNVLNNQKSNLRIVTTAQNNLNKRKGSNNRSGYIGVYRDSYYYDCWRWMVKHNGKKVAGGICTTAREAARQRDAAARIYHGEFAVLNFPTK